MSQNLSVLLVDDDREQRAALRELLEANGCAVMEAASGRQALARLLSFHTEPQVILLDLLMPDMSGERLLEALWSYSRVSTIPVFVISGTDPNRVPVTRPVARRFVKPVDPQQLLDAIDEVLPGQRF